MNNNSTQETVRYSSIQLIKDILVLLKPYKWKFIWASCVRLFGDLANLFPTFAFASIVTFLTTYKTGDSLKYIWIILGLWFVASVIRYVNQFFAKYIGYYIAEKLSIDSTLKSINHMFLLDMSWHEQENSGNKIKRINGAADGLNKIIRIWFDSIIEIIVNFIAINIIIYNFDHTVLGCLMVFFVAYFTFSFFVTRKAGLASDVVNKQNEQVSGLMFESVNNIRTIKVMSMAPNIYHLIKTYTDDLLLKIKKRIFWFRVRNNFLDLLTHSFRIGIVIVIIYGITKGQYALGFLILFNGYFSNLRESVDELSQAIQDFVTARYAVSRMKDILNEPVNIDDNVGKIAVPENWEKIVFNDVSFSYGENQVLKNISFEINRGDKVGIVGLSGAGKSTLFKLLLKEREEFDGDIMFDHVSLTKIQKDDYFKQASVVLQDTEVFNFSLRENITITNSQEKDNVALLNKAINVAHISDFVGKLPQGLDTIIGEKGVKLSGGERQRLGIARAVFKDPQILLLDEATSHLDLESEEKIKDSLHKFFENVTAIVIAHRLTTIKEMDKILVIENGELIESGSFKELSNQNGRFFELWEKQNL